MRRCHHKPTVAMASPTIVRRLTDLGRVVDEISRVVPGSLNVESNRWPSNVVKVGASPFAVAVREYCSLNSSAWPERVILELPTAPESMSSHSVGVHCQMRKAHVKTGASAEMTKRVKRVRSSQSREAQAATLNTGSGSHNGTLTHKCGTSEANKTGFRGTGHQRSGCCLETTKSHD